MHYINYDQVIHIWNRLLRMCTTYMIKLFKCMLLLVSRCSYIHNYVPYCDDTDVCMCADLIVLTISGWECMHWLCQIYIKEMLNHTVRYPFDLQWDQSWVWWISSWLELVIILSKYEDWWDIMTDYHPKTIITFQDPWQWNKWHCRGQWMSAFNTCIDFACTIIYDNICIKPIWYDLELHCT